jgi:5-methylthioadenosine/S-adenosylhomocysteine deaminase
MGAKTLIYNAVLVNPDLPPQVLQPGWLMIEGDRIHSLGSGDPPAAQMRAADERIEAHGGIALPGLVNGHNHAAMTLFRGLADDLPLQEWLEGHIFPVEAGFVDEDFVYWGTLLACAEMIRSGTTAFADGYFFEERALDAVKAAGMRALLAAGVVDFPTPNCPDPETNVERGIAFLNCSWGEEPIQTGLFCHAPYTCSPETLSKAKEACQAHGVPFFIHVSETQWEVEEIRRRYGASPVHHLHRLGILDDRTVLIHGTWVDESEIRILAQRRCGVVICTESNMKLATGIAPLPAFLDGEVRVGLGTDSAASNNDLDLFGEMNLTAKLQKLHWGNPTFPDAETVLHLATRGGARLLGWQDVGLLAPGYRADLILMRTDRPSLLPLYHPVSQLVYAATGSDVDSVWIHGKPVMRSRRLLTLDEDEIYRQCRRIAGKIAAGLRARAPAN